MKYRQARVIAIICFLCVASFSITVFSEEALRTWTSLGGKTVEGSFVRMEGANVVIKSATGGRISIKIDNLSEDDRVYVRELQKSLQPKPAPKSLLTLHATSFHGNKTSKWRSKLVIEVKNISATPEDLEIRWLYGCGARQSWTGETVTLTLKPLERKEFNVESGCENLKYEVEALFEGKVIAEESKL